LPASVPAPAAKTLADKPPVAHDGVSTELLTTGDRTAVRAALKLPSDNGPVILAGGWTLRRDRQQLALWAAAILSMLDPKVRIIVPGDTEQREVLAEWIRQAGYGQIAVWPGRRFDWPALLAAADVFIHAGAAGTARAARATGGSRADKLEADSTPIWWAMLAGVPIVAMDGPGPRELLTDGRTALLCPTDRPRDLAMRVRQLLIDKPLADRLTAQARQEAIGRLRSNQRSAVSGQR
jgi:glycosyltransferase involved in cell wall biosynthesis